MWFDSCVFSQANKDTANLKKSGEQDLKAMSAGIKGMPKFQVHDEYMMSTLLVHGVYMISA